MTPQLQRGKSAAVLCEMATLDIWNSPQDTVIPPCLLLLPFRHIHFFSSLMHTLPSSKAYFALIYCHCTHSLCLLFLLFPLIRSHLITSLTEEQLRSEGMEQDQQTTLMLQNILTAWAETPKKRAE